MNYSDFVAEEATADAGSNMDSAIEDSFWKSLSRSKECKKYSLDNHMSLFSDMCKYWNLNKFTAEDSLIHGKVSIFSHFIKNIRKKIEFHTNSANTKSFQFGYLFEFLHDLG